MRRLFLYSQEQPSNIEPSVARASTAAFYLLQQRHDALRRAGVFPLWGGRARGWGVGVSALKWAELVTSVHACVILVEHSSFSA